MSGGVVTEVFWSRILGKLRDRGKVYLENTGEQRWSLKVGTKTSMGEDVGVLSVLL